LLISEKVETKWNSRTKKHYEEKGYLYTTMGDTIVVNVFDLKDNSMVYVDVQCDYCNKIYQVMWSHRTKFIKDNPNHKDCCLICTPKKAKETILEKYGVDNIMYLDEFKDKIKQTNLNRYGVENVFQSEEIKDKIKQVNLEQYGVESYTQTQECKDKKILTCLKRYKTTHPMKTDKYRLMFAREKSPVWKGGIRTKRTERLTLEYREWRRKIFKQDNYTCCKCHENSNRLEAHHILSWKENNELRYDISNGITLCKDCHRKFHSKYGKTTANREDLLEFIQT